MGSTLLHFSTSPNEVPYWKHTENVRRIRVRQDEAGGTERNVRNETPLRVELWLNSDREVIVDIEFKDPPS